MVDKRDLHLGQMVLVGKERKPAVVDGLTQTFAGVFVLGEGYEFCDYDEIEVEEPEYV